MQSFIIPPAGRIDRRRRLAETLGADAVSTAPIQSWTQGAARLAQALAATGMDYRANQMEQERMSALQQALGGGSTPDQLMATMDPQLMAIAKWRADQQQAQAEAARQAAAAEQAQSNWQASFDQDESQFQRRLDADAAKAAIPQASDVLGVIKAYEASPGVKRYREVNPTLGSMHKSLDDPSAIADLDFVYGVAKVLDPESVVRESEQGNIIASQSIPQSILGQLNKFMTGQQALTPEVRRNLYELARRRGAELQGQAQHERDYYLQFGQPYGVGETQLRGLEELPPELSPVPQGTPHPFQRKTRAGVSWGIE